jgi:hypothetical protein
MAESLSDHRVSITKLILVPSLITLGVTILRVVGELQNWSPIFFRKSAGGGGAIVGIAWLPLIFGIYFALKLYGAGEGPASVGRTMAFWALGLVLLIAGGYLGLLAFKSGKAALVLFVAAIVGQFYVWPSLAQTLTAYAFAARIPVLIVMYLAFQGSWGTHYDAMPPGYVSKGFAADFWTLAVVPQMFNWIAFTLLVGTLTGVAAVAIARRPKHATAPAA